MYISGLLRTLESPRRTVFTLHTKLDILLNPNGSYILHSEYRQGRHGGGWEGRKYWQMTLPLDYNGRLGTPCVKVIYLLSSPFKYFLYSQFVVKLILTFVVVGGGLYVPPPPHFVFIFLLKISPHDQTLRPTCKFLILGILYHYFFFFWKFSISKVLPYNS